MDDGSKADTGFKADAVFKADTVFKALADASRRELLDRLRAENGQTLNELCARLDMTRQAVSKHLVILEDANLVATVWRGREKLHYLNPVPIHEIAERWIGKFERSRLQALSDMKQALEQSDE
jgi:DNA-binding transcriptional ArsR family regulator